MDTIWVPDNARDLLLVTIDLTQSGETEWEGMLLVNSAAGDWVNGRIDTGTYMDILESVGINPDSFIKEAERYVYNMLLATLR